MFDAQLLVYSNITVRFDILSLKISLTFLDSYRLALYL